MTSPRHLAYFVALGLFWGISPRQYRYWGEAGVPVSHILVFTGFGLALFFGALGLLRHGALGWNREMLTYTLVCAMLMNLPFSLSLTFARHGIMAGEVSWWLIASFINPLLYAGYNLYAQRHWPKGGTTFSIGAAESFWTGVLALPFMLAIAAPWTFTYTGLAYGSIAVATVMWVAERVSFFTLIREKGASYTSQAVYLSAPAAVIFAVIFFGGASDHWLWAALAILMAALWLNNSEPAAKPRSI